MESVRFRKLAKSISVFCLCACFNSSSSLLGQAAADSSQTSIIPDRSARSSTGPSAAENKPSRPIIGLALEGGGALGLAHIGVLKWMEENRVPIDRLAGTSMGALVGGLYASGRTPAEIEKIALSSRLKTIFTLEPAYTEVSFRRKEDRKQMPQAINVGLKDGADLRNSFLTDSGLNTFLREELSAYNSEAVLYDRLPIPFRCVATDLNTMSPVVFDRGPIPQAVRASVAIPGVFSPVSYQGHYLVDGGIMDNLPTDVLKNTLHADVILAVHLPLGPLNSGDVSSVIGVLERAFSSGVARTERSGMALADILIEAQTEKYNAAEYEKASQFIQLGYEAAERQKAKLLQYSLSDQEWKAYLQERHSRMRPSPGAIEELRVEGGGFGVRSVARTELDALLHKPITTESINKALCRIQENGSYESSFETFPVTRSLAVKEAEAVPDGGLLVRLNGVQNGPPFLLVGGNVQSSSGNPARATFDLRFVDQNLGGFGSELRSDIQLGYLTRISMEYYRQLLPSGWFVQPHLGILRRPVYIWSDQKRIAERFEQQAGGGVDFGRTIGRNMQIAAQWRAESVRWKMTTGSDGQGNLSGTAQRAMLQFNYDSTTSAVISPRGLLLNVTAGKLFHSVASKDSPFLKANFTHAHSIQERNVFVVGGEIDTYFRNNVADPLRFTLGGPGSLSASSIEEYRGTDLYFAHTAYLRKLSSLPHLLGEGLYAATIYEAGQVWSPERRSFLRQDGGFGVVISTPLGSMLLGGAVGDAGRRKVFFSLGRLF